jgi:hypothetical protein
MTPFCSFALSNPFSDSARIVTVTWPARSAMAFQALYRLLLSAVNVRQADAALEPVAEGPHGFQNHRLDKMPRQTDATADGEWVVGHGSHHSTVRRLLFGAAQMFWVRNVFRSSVKE